MSPRMRGALRWQVGNHLRLRRNSPLGCIFAPLILLAFCIQGGFGAKDLVEKTRPSGFEVCRNTMKGMWYVTDDKGYICKTSEIDPMTGCCADGDQHSCESCELEDKCCSVYENCVSCCLNPKYEPSKELTADRAAGHPETGHWPDEYEYCRGKCRTHVRSTVHENAYLDKRHYCFSSTGRPLAKEPDMPPLPATGEIFPGQPGEDCNTVCKQNGMACLGQHFSSINSCNTLRDFFNCEAACEVDPESEHWEPYYVSGKAPKSQRPAACFIGEFGKEVQGGDACGWKEGHFQRLCACGQEDTA